MWIARSQALFSQSSDFDVQIIVVVFFPFNFFIFFHESHFKQPLSATDARLERKSNLDYLYPHNVSINKNQRYRGYRQMQMNKQRKVKTQIHPFLGQNFLGDQERLNIDETRITCRWAFKVSGTLNQLIEVQQRILCLTS